MALIRHVAVREAERLNAKVIRETGGNNRGPWVEAIQRSDTLRSPDTVYAWCQSAQNALWRLATGGRWTFDSFGRPRELVGGEHLADGTASVWFFASWARARGYGVTRPLKGDHVVFMPYTHVGLVDRVVRWGGVFATVWTYEGNTSSSGAIVSDAGSDSDGFYRKRRTVLVSSVQFYRVPGDVDVPEPETPARRRARLRALRAWILARQQAGWSWARIKRSANWREYRRRGGR